jgi:outer membrane protein/adhesin transport system outer membrane protein
MPGHRAALGLAVALSLAGCSVNEAAEVRKYRAVLDAGLDAEALAALPAELDVVSVMTLANARNESLAVEGESYVQSLIDKRRAAAAFLPTLTLAPSYIWRNQTGDSQRDNTGFNTPLVAAAAVSPVRDVSVLRSAGATAKEREALLMDFQDGLLLDVARTHYDVIRSERAVAVLEGSLAVQDERVRDARARLDAGIASPLDLSLSEALAARTSSDLTVARVRVRNARSVLGFLTVEPLADRALVDNLELPPSVPDSAALLAEAQAHRQDVRAAERHIEAATQLVRSAYGQYFPAVSLNLQWFLQRDSEPKDLDWTSLIQMSLPLFSAGLIEADVREALSVLRQAKLQYSLTERGVARDLEIAHDNLLSSLERAERRRVQVRAAGDALQQAEGLYSAGLSTNLERLVAQDSLLNAELDLVNAELDAKVFYLDLRRTLGTLHELVGIHRPGDAETDTARAAVN